MRKMLFLSAQFTGYFYECLKELVTHHHFEVQVIRWESATNVPYQFSEYQGIIIDLKSDFTPKKLLEKCLSLQPDLVYYPGWMDNDYLKIVAQLRQKGTISIMGLDNQWHGAFKQRVIALMGYRIFKRLFKADYIWVAGEQQAEYMKRIGFPKTKILYGLYSANQPVFNAEYQQYKSLKIANYPKKFLSVGRFEKVKNPLLLYQVFKNLVQQDLHKGWTLTMIGAGTEEVNLKPSQNIEIKNFIQPEDLPMLIPQFGCFVLPSSNEPWGVVVHEAVSAGLPLILSSVTGAGTLFLKENDNGFSFHPNDEEAVKNAFLKIINSDDETLIRMSERSSELSFLITPKTWAITLNNIC
jgi:glycosyltransferase involved in cell wall biosynthesis